MKYNPFQDQKFLTLLVDATCFLALYFMGKYGSVSFFDDAKTVFATVQPLVLLAIANMFVGDVQALRAGVKLSFFKPK